jgi:hypothetical protein
MNELPHLCVHPFVVYSGLSTMFGSVNSVLATDCQLYALNSFKHRHHRTQLYVYKDVFGQMLGMGVALYRGKIAEGIVYRGMQCITLQQAALIMEMYLNKRPKWYMPATCASNVLRNVAWIGLGAINAQCFVDVSKETGCDVPEVYTTVNIANTLASSIGLCIGTKLTRYVNVKSIHVTSSLLYVAQLSSFYAMTRSIMGN